MDQFISFITHLNWSVPTWDIFILLFFVVGALLYGLSLGRDRIIVILVSIYMSLAIVSNTPILNTLDASPQLNQNAIAKIAFFLVIFVVLFFLVTRSALLKTVGRSGAPGDWWQTILFSVLQVGLLISITLNFLPKDVTQGLSDMTKQIFMSDQGRSIWMVLPVLVMIVAPKQKVLE